MGRNRAYYGRWVQFEDNVDDVTQKLVFDPQTSGGLLIALEPNKTDSLLNELAQMNVETAKIGTVKAGDGQIIIH